MGTAPTRPAGYRLSLATVAGRPQGFPPCPPLSPSPRRGAAHRRWLPPNSGSAERARTPGRSPGNPRPFFPSLLAPPSYSSSSFLSLCLRTRARTASRSPSAAPSPPLAGALSPARSGACGAGAHRPPASPVSFPPHPEEAAPTPGARSSRSSGKLHPCSSLVSPLPSAALRGAGDTLQVPTDSSPAAMANPEGLEECEPCLVSGSTAGGADGGF